MRKDLLRLLGVGIFLVILYQVDLRQVWNYIKETDLLTLLYGFLLGIPILFVRAYRWYRIKGSLEIRVSLWRSFLYQVISGMSWLTPARMGEIIKAVYLKGQNWSFTRSTISIVIDRTWDLVVIATLAGIAVLFLGDVGLNLTVLLILLGITAAGLILFRSRDLVRTLLGRVVRAIVPDKVSVHLHSVLDQTIQYFKQRSLRWYGLLFILTLGVFFLQVYRIQVFAHSLGFSIPLLPLSGIISIMVITNLLPISVSGLGTRDAIFIYYFAPYGIPQELALGLSFLLLVNVVVQALISTVVFILHPPGINLRQILEEVQ